jgi:hypothetical protein
VSKTSRNPWQVPQRAENSMPAAAGRGRHSRAPVFSDRLLRFVFLWKSCPFRLPFNYETAQSNNGHGSEPRITPGTDPSG